MRAEVECDTNFRLLRAAEPEIVRVAFTIKNRERVLR